MAPHNSQSRPKLQGILLLLLCLAAAATVHGGSWCVARSDATHQALQRGLDYACGSGADCVPIQSEGLCFLPNTIQGHASYAFNSYYQRNAMAPGSCNFAGTATVAVTDPSYGSCVYPSSRSTAGGTPSTGTGTPLAPSTSSSTPTITGIPTIPTGPPLTPPNPTSYNGTVGVPYSGSTSLGRFLASTTTLAVMMSLSAAR